jgi:hypothetical protein
MVAQLFKGYASPEVTRPREVATDPTFLTGFKLRHWDIHPVHLWAFEYLFGFILECPNAPKQHKKLFSGRFGLFLLQEWA